MKGQSKNNYMPYENNRMVAKPKAIKKAAPASKTLLPKPFKDEREMANAMAKAKATPTAKPKVTATTISKGEAAFLKELKNGKTFAQARKIILDKYGFSPNGQTN